MNDQITRIIDDYDRGRLSRRQLIAFLAALGMTGTAVRAVAGQDPGEAQAEPTFLALEVDHVALDVTDVPRSRDFYVKHFGMGIRSDSPRSCFLNGAEDNFLALFQGSEPGLNHYCFSVRDYDPDDAVERLSDAGLSPERHQNRVYFPDPDGIQVQVAAPAHG